MLPFDLNDSLSFQYAVVVPGGALVIDWVFADGLPKGAVLYDNNSYQDFHALVPRRTPEEIYWLEEENLMFRKLQEDRRLKEEAMRVKVSAQYKLILFIILFSFLSSFFLLLFFLADGENSSLESRN